MDKKSTTGAPTTVTDLLQRIKGKPVIHKVVESITQDVITESQANPGTMYLTPSGIMMAGYIIAEANAINDVSSIVSDNVITLTKKTSDNGEYENIVTDIASKTYVDNAISSGFAAADAIVFVGTIDAQTNIQNWNEHAMGPRPSTEAYISIVNLPKYVDVSAGYTFKFTAPNPNVFGQNVEADDILIVTRDVAKNVTSGVLTANDVVIIQKNVDKATTTTLGLVKFPENSGLSIQNDGSVYLNSAGEYSTTGGVLGGVFKITNPNIDQWDLNSSAAQSAVVTAPALKTIFENSDPYYTSFKGLMSIEMAESDEIRYRYWQELETAFANHKSVFIGGSGGGAYFELHEEYGDSTVHYYYVDGSRLYKFHFVQTGTTSARCVIDVNGADWYSMLIWQ